MKHILFLFHDKMFHLYLNALRPIQIDNRYKMSLGKFKPVTRILVPEKQRI